MMDVRDVMKIDIDNLKRTQLEALKDHTIKILRRVIDCVYSEDFSSIDAMIQSSPAGDGYGQDNVYIDFTYLEDESMDIGDMVEAMQRLK